MLLYKVHSLEVTDKHINGRYVKIVISLAKLSNFKSLLGNEIYIYINSV